MKSIKFDLNSIQTKMVVTYLLVGLFPLAILSFLSIRNAEKTTDQNLKGFGSLAVAGINEIDQQLNESYEDVQIFTHDPLIKNEQYWTQGTDGHKALIENINNSVKLYHGLYSLIMILDTDGNLVAVNSADKKGRILDTRFMYRTNFSDEDFFYETMEERENAFVSNAKVHDFLAKAYDNDGFSMCFSAPIRNNDGSIKGVLVLAADFAFIEKTLPSLYDLFNQQGYQSVELTLIDSKGTILVDYDPLFNNEKKSISRDIENIVGVFNLVDQGLELADKAVNVNGGDFGYMESVHHRKNISQLGVYAHSDGFEKFAGLDWSILIRIDSEEAHAGENTIKSHIWIVSIFCLVLILLLALFMAGSFARPISRAVVCVEALAKGDLTSVITSRRKDELGTLAHSFNNTLSQLKIIINDLTDNAQCLTNSSAGMASLSQQLAGNSTRVAEEINIVAASGEQLSSNIASMSNSAEHIADSTASVSQSLKHMTSSIKDVSLYCNKEVEITDSANSIAQETEKLMNELGESAEEVGKIVGMIDEIADQTNLLALNATIEAASAGAAGKGFAVVANEVKDLAGQSAKATEKITSQIGEIQKKIEKSVEAIGTITVIIQDVNRISKEISGSVADQFDTAQKISDNMANVSQVIEELACSIKEISGGATDVSKSIQQVAGPISETSESAIEIDSSARRLGTIASQINEVVEKFKV